MDPGKQIDLGDISQKSGLIPDRVVRTFWHGPFSPYEALCLSSFVTAGVGVELFSEAPVPGLPDGVIWRNAREILDQEVVFYRHEFDGPSPALHANIFRYALLEKLGGWWIDTDVMLTAAQLPAVTTFIAQQSDQELAVGAMRFPPRHPLMKAALERAAAGLEDARWGETGPKLLTELQPLFAPEMLIAPRQSTYEIGSEEFQKFFLPQAREEIEARTGNSTFVHLWNEMWRKAGVPKNIAPPNGSWLDRMFERHQVAAVWSDRLDGAYIERWANLRRDRDHAGHYNLVHDRELRRLRAERDARWFGMSRTLVDMRARAKRRLRRLWSARK
ncbi:glycosyltransferase [Bradyrhizobium sp.]|uniref:glycosyltransferase n=1 Tax=Bradyrhizobium sp. TaxID=376 RepID=UPI002720C302|nr:glycosyltransferase [Bradyrhizobium sp.]MDO9297473.1 glycosyltransferase [Bradyrhizobium sp.]